MFQKLFSLSFGDDKKKKPVGFADFGMGPDEQARCCQHLAPMRHPPRVKGGSVTDRPRTFLAFRRWEAPAMRARGQGP